LIYIEGKDVDHIERTMGDIVYELWRL